MSRPLMVLLALSGCGSVGATAELAELAAMAPDSDATRVEVAVVAASSAVLTLDLPGEISGADDALLATPLGGLVERVHVAEGEEVRKGKVLIEVDGAVYAAQRDLAAAQLEQAEADLARSDSLGDLATDAELTRERTQVKISQANLRQAQANLDRAVVRAPFSGTVGMLDVSVGEMASPGTPLLRLVSLDPVEVDISVSDRDVVSLEPGMEARVSTQASSGVRSGVVSEVSPVADLRTRSFVATIRVPNPEHDLLPGMIAQVGIDHVVAEDAIVLPQDWIVTKLTTYGVFVADAGVARWREVTLGDIIRGQVVVTSGLEAGERVVTVGQHGLVDGDALMISREGTCCTNGRAIFNQPTAAR